MTPYHLRNCAYHEEFEKDKLCWMHMSPVARFSFVEGGTYCNQKGFIMLGSEIEYLCAVLNSQIVSTFVKSVAVTTGMGLIQWDKFTVEDIPVPLPTKPWRARMKALTKSCLACEPEARGAIINEVEDCVRDLYGLDERERLLLDRNFDGAVA